MFFNVRQVTALFNTNTYTRSGNAGIERDLAFFNRGNFIHPNPAHALRIVRLQEGTRSRPDILVRICGDWLGVWEGGGLGELVIGGDFVFFTDSRAAPM